ncbi:sulfite exporter TauE/SafE family protein [Thermodesulfobacteriota bacterium]
MMLAVTTAVILVLAFIFSMLGLGGAMLYIPVFHWFGYDFKSVAIPTGLLLNGITVVSASIVYFRSKMVDVKGSIPLVVTSFIGAPLGAFLTSLVPTRTLILLFALCMLFAGGRMLLSSTSPDKETMMPFHQRAMLMAVGGFFIGMVAGLLGIGGGFLFVPLMLAMGYPTKQAAATSAFVVIFSSFSGFAGHVAEGHFNWPLMVVTGIAVVVGAQVGAYVMKEKMKAKWIKQMFAVVLLAVAVKLLWKLYL